MYAERCGGTDSVWEARMDRDTWLTPEEAMEINLIDHIMTKRGE